MGKEDKGQRSRWAPRLIVLIFMLCWKISISLYCPKVRKKKKKKRIYTYAASLAELITLEKSLWGGKELQNSKSESSCWCGSTRSDYLPLTEHFEWSHCPSKGSVNTPHPASHRISKVVGIQTSFGWRQWQKETGVSSISRTWTSTTCRARCPGELNSEPWPRGLLLLAQLQLHPVHTPSPCLW